MAKVHECSIDSHEGEINKRMSRGEETDGKYTSDDLRSAIGELGKGVSLSRIALKYNIPKSTLCRKSKVYLPSATRGPSAVLTEAEERHIAGWIRYRKDQRYPVTKKKIIDYVQKYLNNNKRKTIFKNNKPGNRWYEYFLKKHSILVEGHQDLKRDKVTVKNQKSEKKERDHPDLPTSCRTEVKMKIDGHVSNHMPSTSNSPEFDSINVDLGRRSGKKDDQTKYTVDDLESALNELGKGVSLSRIARKYGIPKSTLFRKSKNYSTIVCRKGPPTVLTEAEEKHVAAWIKYRLDQGFPVSKRKIIDHVQKFLNNSTKKTPFKNNRPGLRWYRSFMRRQSMFSVRGVQIFKCDRSLSHEDEECEEAQSNTSNIYAPVSGQLKEVTDDQNLDRIANILDFLENQLIGPDMLQNFQSTYEEFGVTEPQGISQEALFEVWCELQRMIGKERRLDNSFEGCPNKIITPEGVFLQSQCDTNKIHPELIYVINREAPPNETSHPSIVNTYSQTGTQTIQMMNQDQSLSGRAADDSMINWDPQLSPEERKEVQMLESQRRRQDEEREIMAKSQHTQRKKLDEQKNVLRSCQKNLSGRMKEIEEKIRNGFSSGSNGILSSDVSVIFSHLFDIEKTLLELVKQGLYKIDLEEKSCS